MDRPAALVVDRDPHVRERIRELLKRDGIEGVPAATVDELRHALRSPSIRLVLFDVGLPGLDAAELIAADRRTGLSPFLIPLAGADEEERGLALVDAGAFDVAGKPIDDRRLRAVVRRAWRAHERLVALEGGLRHGEFPRSAFVGRSPAIEALRRRLERLAETDVTLWFHGEPGTGKERAAREVHRLSRRAAAAFVVLDCAEAAGSSSRAVPEGEGRLAAVSGVVARAEGGTLYLDELSALEPAEQQQLVAALSGGRAGGSRPDLRLCVGSRLPPARLIEEGRLEGELFARLGSESVALPSLRERPEDIVLLAAHFIAELCAINRLPPPHLDGETLALLERQRWPENLDGLRVALEHAMIVSSDGRIRPRDLPEGVRDPGTVKTTPREGGVNASRPFREAKREVVESFEGAYLRALMERHHGNVTAAAHQAGMLRSALQRLLRKYAIRSAEFRRERVAPRER